MSKKQTDDARPYLLGQMSEDEQAALERGYFADPERLEDVAAAESELVDAYLAGDLAAGERAAFESHYLASPVHRDRLDTATRLRLATVARRRRPPVAWIALAAAALLALGVSWWWTAPVPAPSQRAEGPSPAPTALAPATEPSAATTAPPTRTPKRVVTLSLAAVRVRGDQPAPELRLAPSADEVVLRLGGLDAGESGPLSFSVRTVEGAEAAEGRVEGSGAAEVGRVRVRAALLPADDYIVAVSSPAGTTVAQYFFRVLR